MYPNLKLNSCHGFPVKAKLVVYASLPPEVVAAKLIFTVGFTKGMATKSRSSYS
jgi:hypothetical protein